MRTDDGEHYEWHGATKGSAARMCTVAASSPCRFRRTSIHTVPPSFSEDPDILRD